MNMYARQCLPQAKLDHGVIQALPWQQSIHIFKGYFDLLLSSRWIDQHSVSNSESSLGWNHGTVRTPSPGEVEEVSATRPL